MFSHRVLWRIPNNAGSPLLAPSQWPSWLRAPDYNPIEEAFSKVKTLIKTYEEEMESNHMDMLDIVLTAFSHITKEDCQGWIDHCGIYNVT